MKEEDKQGDDGSQDEKLWRKVKPGLGSDGGDVRDWKEEEWIL